jgi:hypothetical protein
MHMIPNPYSQTYDMGSGNEHCNSDAQVLQTDNFTYTL